MKDDFEFVPNDDISEDQISFEIPDTAEADYQAYLEIANRPEKPFGDKILSFEEFIVVNYSSELTREKKLTELGFVPNVSPGDIVGGINAITNAVNTGTKTVRMVKTAVDDLRGTIKGAIEDGGSNTINVDPPFRGGGSSGGSKSSSHFPIQSLNLNSSPIEVRLDTGIKPRCYGPFYQDTDAYHAPLHLSHVKIYPVTTGDLLDDYYDKVIAGTLQNISQQAVSFNINAANDLSFTNFKAYIGGILNALNDYYFCTSILTYCSVPGNNNAGMKALRAMFTPTDLNNLLVLGEILQSLAIPPNLNQLVFYYNQTFRESSLPGSALLKIMPFSFVTTADANNKFSNVDFSTQLLNRIDLLSTDQFRKTMSLLAKVTPDWCFNKLMHPSEMPLHDDQFLTFWANLPNQSSSTGGTANYTPTVTTASENIVYNTFTNELDGGVIGLTSFRLGANWVPSLIFILFNTYATTRFTNRISYCIAGDGTAAFIPAANTNAGLPFSRNETYTLTTGPFIYQKFGTETVLNVNIDSVRETSRELLKWMMSFDSIGAGQREKKDVRKPRVKHVNDTRSSNPSDSEENPYKRRRTRK